MSGPRDNKLSRPLDSSSSNAGREPFEQRLRELSAKCHPDWQRTHPQRNLGAGGEVLYLLASKRDAIADAIEALRRAEEYADDMDWPTAKWIREALARLDNL